ncbi:hypothetical protein BKA65DRAFT_421518 [Rhexocercosporidium sp. MPI-PUGE-AT-0058]|nr:hypothetical protein BKA65DRAFT_421518 [Rhexocercosporidium sp. MPI-PUGE-AT-0058]
MMDPLTVLGLASNIVQFVDFTSKLISATHSLYASSSGAKLENVELEGLTQDLQRLALQVNPPDVSYTRNTMTEEESDLLNLSKQCLEVSTELLLVLESIKVKGNHKKWKSFYQALQSVRKKGEIEALQVRLDRIEQRMGIRGLANKQSMALAMLARMETESQMSQVARTDDIQKLQEEFKHLFAEMRSGADGSAIKQKTLENLSCSAEKGVEYESEQRILASLRFYTMDDRHASIRAAHAQTFSWILEESSADQNSRAPTKFVEWLKSDETLYWVSGKPGSGKSTLMKYLCEHHEVIKVHVEGWTGDHKIIISSFFFWNAGRVSLQKSQEGLLRSMLYQVLRQCPSLISKAFPGHWYSHISGKHNPGYIPGFFNISELLAAFQRVTTELVTSQVKIIFFIDGLDEYEGKPNDIIQLVRLLMSSKQLKICISSRPWNEFEKVYGQDPSRKLYIENLTRKDIELYVRDTFEKDPSYPNLDEEESQSLNLVEEIVDAAKGVFWVFLVVRSLLEGLTNADRIVDLQRRLRLLPTDLNEYFEKILFTINSFYRKQTAHMFQVTLTAHEILPLMSYWFLDQEDPDFAFKLGIESLSVQKTNARLKQMRKRLNACCKGLLEVQFYDSSNYNDSTLSSSVLFNWKVDFLHRTVRDFLILPDMQAMLSEWAGEEFNSDRAICEVILCQIKTAPQDPEYFQDEGPIWTFAQTLKYHADALEADPDYDQDGATLLRELDQTMRRQKEVVGNTNDISSRDSHLTSTENFQSQGLLGGLSKLRSMFSMR